MDSSAIVVVVSRIGGKKCGLAILESAPSRPPSSRIHQHHISFCAVNNAQRYHYPMFARFAASSRISTVRRARNMAAPTRPPPPTGNQLKKNWLSDPGTYPVRKIKDTKILRDKDLTPKILLYMFRLFSLCFVHHLFFFLTCVRPILFCFERYFFALDSPCLFLPTR